MVRSILYYSGALGVLGVALVLVAAGPSTGLVALGLVVLLVAITCLGPDLVGTGFLCLAFGTAPMYKGLVQGASTVTPTDMFLVLGFMLLLPRMLRASFRLPATYILAVIVIGLTTTVGSFVSTDTVVSLLSLTLWLMTMFILPSGMHLLQPDRRTINLLAWMYVIGHLVSTFAGIALGHNGDGGRQYGLTTHPNFFAEAGSVSVGLLLHLWATGNRKLPVLLAMPICIYSVYASGSRAGLLTVALLVAVIPIVERSAVKGYLVAFGAAIGGALVLTTLSAASAGGALGRLSGQGSAAGSDQQRTQGFQEGWDRFTAHPLSGSGLVDLFNNHNNYLEVAVAAGVFGFIAFLVIVFKLVAPLFGKNELRRLCYPALVYAAFGATTPGLYDRTYWVPIALSILAVVPAPAPDEPASAEPVEQSPALSGA